jgi:sulfoxide reductase heme-binding subunit YedZ
MFGKHRNTIIALIALFFVLALPVQGAIQDSDADGLTNQAETEIYLTDPQNPDTDGDSISDGDEILSDTNPISAESHPNQVIESDYMSNKSFAWFIGRSSGVVAFILLTIVVVNGLLITTRLVFRLLPPALNYEMHRFFAWTAFIALIGHIVSFTFDEYFHLTYFEGFVPFALLRDFSSHLGYDLRYAVGIGTIAFYGIIALLITSELKGKGVSLKKWRALHYSSFLTYCLFLAHGYLSGTDSNEWWMLWLYGLSATLVFGLTGLRIYAAIRKKSLPAATPVSSIQTTLPS